MRQKETERELDIIKGNVVQNNYVHITVTKCGGGWGEEKSFKQNRKMKQETKVVKHFFKINLVQ